MLPTRQISAIAAALCLLITLPAAARAADPEVSKPASQAEDVLATVLAAQPEEIKARYAFRRPAETLAFFEVQPGDTVIETLPGGGWYSGILYPYLGEGGKLIGAHYPLSLFERFGWDKERLQNVLARDAGWQKSTASKAGAKGGLIHFLNIDSGVKGKAGSGRGGLARDHEGRFHADAGKGGMAC